MFIYFGGFPVCFAFPWLSSFLSGNAYEWSTLKLVLEHCRMATHNNIRLSRKYLRRHRRELHRLRACISSLFWLFPFTFVVSGNEPGGDGGNVFKTPPGRRYVTELFKIQRDSERAAEEVFHE